MNSTSAVPGTVPVPYIMDFGSIVCPVVTKQDILFHKNITYHKSGSDLGQRNQ